MLRIEIIAFSHVEMRNDVFIGFILQHLMVKRYVVEVLVMLLILEVVDDGQFWRGILE